jgi:hypothetical protein
MQRWIQYASESTVRTGAKTYLTGQSSPCVDDQSLVWAYGRISQDGMLPIARLQCVRAYMYPGTCRNNPREHRGSTVTQWREDGMIQR